MTSMLPVLCRYADNILKGFATSLSIIISCVASYFLFNFVVSTRISSPGLLSVSTTFPTPVYAFWQVNVRFIFGAALVLYAVYVYGSSTAKVARVAQSVHGGSSTPP